MDITMLASSYNLTIVGLLIDFIGALIMTLDLFVSKAEAVRLEVPRWAGETMEDNLSLPSVQARLRGSRRAIVGALLLSLGFLLQLLGALV